MEASGVDNLDRYKSYIQRRRVGLDPSDESHMTETAIEKAESTEASFADTYTDSYRGFSSYGKGSESTKAEDTETPVNSLRRTDPGPYQRLYGQSHKTSPYANNSRYHGYSTSTHSAEIEDNRATVLAVKIIKQALACFAILGIIVLMQQRSDMGGALTFIKKHVVETHIEPNSLLTGVENIVQECSRFLGGSP